MNPPLMSPVRVHAMVNVLMSIPSLNESNARTLYRREIEAILGRQLASDRDPNPRLDLYHLVRGCDQEPGGLDALQMVVDGFNEGAKATSQLRKLIAEWAHEQRLIGILPGDRLDDLLSACELVTGSTPPVSRIATAVQSIGWKVTEPWGAPSILAVVDVLSASTPDRIELSEWLNEVAPHVGWSAVDLKRLRQTTARQMKSPMYRNSKPDVEDGNYDQPEPIVKKRIVIEETPATVSPIRGGIPARNLFFTGRQAIMDDLRDALAAQQRASVLPEATLHGYGGVGKTQIAVEYAYRNADQYQLIWWMPAEDPAAVRAQLSVLAERLGLPSGGTMEQTVRSVLDTLASTTSMSWLLVYDNAGDPSTLEGLIPSAGGHVLITSRNPLWAASNPALEVDVFTREESMEMLRRHHPDMLESEADRLAEVLGDLPLALEQAASWLVTTLTSVDDYLEEFERRKRQLLAEGKPRNYPNTVATFVGLAVDRMRRQAPVAAQMLELLAFLGPEPVSSTLLWEGRAAEIREPLRTALQERNEVARVLRELVGFGVAKANRARQVTIHRLVLFVLREELVAGGKLDGLRDARRLLAAANPGYPDDRDTWQRHAELRPHIHAADLIKGEADARQAVMDQLRYIYNTGDFEGCCELALEILDAWDKPVQEGGYGPEDPLTLLAVRRYADALRSLGDRRAAEHAKRALDGMMATLGESHEYTMGAIMGVAADLRIEGKFAEARELDDRNLERHLEVLGPGDPSTLRAMNSVALNLRWAGDFKRAYEIDVEAERQARSSLGELEAWTFLAVEGQARDLLLLGRYREALDLQQAILPDHIGLLGETHITVLRAQTLVASMLRKTGRITEAVAAARATYRSVSVRFGPEHPLTLAATVTLANTLRAAGDPAQALSHIIAAREGYTRHYGPDHGLTLCAAVNEGVIDRALGYDRDALAIDEHTLGRMKEILGEEHPFALSAAVNLGSDLSRLHRLEEALAITERMWQACTRIRGARHPYTLHAATNTAIDMIQLGRMEEGEALLRETVVLLEGVYGAGHPEPEAARRYRRLECELEPPLI
ncbi:FxSxx-COOH system tetratricopeptide repeat protein [Allorhizocola rhizosphaerae]|uniref:FxSxx-COOH system tetratricopeptide repeat protein n=1 Tax=Allorhizocola rhizosphaerae TaxID=1872709 RepID=UPI0013C3472E|nr:FxSxx-COOH system tetratricopeptide repeat protein [Allorhizocola rhizosphaerae]